MESLSYLPKTLLRILRPSKSKCDDPKLNEEESAPLWLGLAGFLSYGLLFVVGAIRDLVFGVSYGKSRDYDREGYAPLYASFDSFYLRNLVRRYKDAFFIPMASVPGATIELRERKSDDHFWTFKMTDKTIECINLGSYNYLGFAENEGLCNRVVEEEVKKHGLSNCSSRYEYGISPVHLELEERIARFLGSEDSVVFGMGFATNSMNLPALLPKGSLVISDQLNHASSILGMRLSGACVKVFRHNDVDHLEKVLRDAIIKGQPRTRRAWKKIVILIEGIYSMEGSIVKLPQIVALKKKYKAYLYLDEAHSVGAMGPNGRGIVDYFGVDPKDIDIMMGTFSKSFGSVGGYLAGSKRVMDYLRVHSQASMYATTLSPACARQVIASMTSIMGEPINGEYLEYDGMARVRRLSKNIHYFRRSMQKKGFIVYGDDDSPVIPMMLFLPSRMSGFVNLLRSMNVATVGVGYPAVPLGMERARFCVSAGHTEEMMDKAIEAIDRAGDMMMLKHSRKIQYKDVDVIYGE